MFRKQLNISCEKRPQWLKKFPETLATSQQVKKAKNEYESFSKEVPIPGFRESLTANHWSISVVWIICMIVGLALTIYFISCVVIEYLNEPTATKIKHERQKYYDFPPIYFCFDKWQNEQNLLSKNATHQAIQYLYSLGGSEEYAITDWKTYEAGRNDFEDFALKENLTHYEDAMKIGSWQLTQFNLSCAGCSSYELVYSGLGLRSCYKTYFKPITAAKAVVTIFVIHFNPPSHSNNNYILVGLDHKKADPMDFISIKNEYTYQFRINAKRNKILNTVESPCFSKGPSGNTMENYNQKSCFLQCAQEVFTSQFNCIPLNDKEKIFDPNRHLDICSTIHEFEVNEKRNLTEDSGYRLLEDIEENATISCQSKCLEPCESLSYEFSMFPLSYNPATNVTIVFFQLLYAQNGIESYEEVPTYSFQSAISNIGGQLGLWMGLSIVTMFQVILYFVNKCLKK